MSLLLTKPTRRNFLGLLSAGAAGAVAAAVVDPERLLWVPGKKLVSVPKPFQPIGLSVRFMADPGISYNDFIERYLAPAEACLDSAIHRLDVKRFKLAKLPLPQGDSVTFSRNIDRTRSLYGNYDLQNIRQIVHFEAETGRFINRLDVLVVPA